MSEEDYRNLKRLSRCTFLPGSYEKRFVRNMLSVSQETVLTSKQKDYLNHLVHRYRKQLSHIK